MHPVSAELPLSLCEILVREFLPEILHDLNNESAVLDGAAHLLTVGARDPQKVMERASHLAQVSRKSQAAIWTASAVAHVLGSPLEPQPRPDALQLLLEIAASATRRAGGTWRPVALPPESIADPRASVVLAAFFRYLTQDARHPTAIDLAGPAGTHWKIEHLSAARVLEDWRHCLLSSGWRLSEPEPSEAYAVRCTVHWTQASQVECPQARASDHEAGLTRDTME